MLINAYKTWLYCYHINSLGRFGTCYVYTNSLTDSVHLICFVRSDHGWHEMIATCVVKLQYTFELLWLNSTYAAAGKLGTTRSIGKLQGPQSFEISHLTSKGMPLWRLHGHRQLARGMVLLTMWDKRALSSKWKATFKYCEITVI